MAMIHTSDAVQLAWGYKDLTDMMADRMVQGQFASYTEMVRKFSALQKRCGVILANNSYMEQAYKKALEKDRRRAEIAKQVFGG